LGKVSRLGVAQTLSVFKPCTPYMIIQCF